MNPVHPNGRHGLCGNHLGWRGLWGYGYGDWHDHTEWSGDLCVKHTRTCYHLAPGATDSTTTEHVVWEAPSDAESNRFAFPS